MYEKRHKNVWKNKSEMKWKKKMYLQKLIPTVVNLKYKNLTITLWKLLALYQEGFLVKFSFARVGKFSESKSLSSTDNFQFMLVHWKPHCGLRP